MSDTICRFCGVGISFIHLRTGPAWCHTLGVPRCAGRDTFAVPIQEDER